MGTETIKQLIDCLTVFLDKDASGEYVFINEADLWDIYKKSGALIVSYCEAKTRYENFIGSGAPLIGGF